MPKPTKFYGLQVHDGIKWSEPYYPGLRTKDQARKAAKASLYDAKAVRLITYTPTQVTLYGEKT